MTGTDGVLDVLIGADVGGTHTDVLVMVGDQMRRGKALTTYDDFSRGVLEAVGVAAERLDSTAAELLGRTRLFINGTTVVTNTITELRGSRVGVLITKGFRDTLRFAGGPRTTEFDDHLQVNVPDLVPREALVEIEERIDWAGNVLVPLDVGEVRAGVRRLVEEVKVDALAVCFLSSFVNGEHELAAEAAIREAYPDVFTTLSHRVFPVAGETRRFTTAILNSFVHERAEAYLESLSTRLREAGLKGNVAFFQGLGGGISPHRAKEYPLALLGSGPAAGAIGANELAKRMGHKRVLLGDMGGTSFDTGIIVENEIHVEKNLQLGPFQTGVNIVDVVSVGAGGGSIAWIDERGVPQVGPQSAGADPGPVAYSKGGVEPTVTDAMVVMGFIDPERYLGGRFKLDVELARGAVAERIGMPFGWTPEEAANAIHDLVVVNMANAVREVSVGKGHDPREFLFLAYGGTLPLFASQIAERLDISTIVIPQNSSVFCALGLLSSDFVLRRDQAVGWDLSNLAELDSVNALAVRIAQDSREEMAAEGFDEAAITMSPSADFRFQGQSYELTMRVPARALTPDDVQHLSEQFVQLYERTYGEGTAWKGVPVTLVNYSVTVTGHENDVPRGRAGGLNRHARHVPAVREERDVYLPGLRRLERIAIYDDAQFAIGDSVSGPSIIDAVDTTIYVPPGTTAARDEHMNLVMTR